MPDDHAVASLLLSRFNFLRRPGLHVVHIASEMVPVAKVGGLGDVVTGLAKAHQQRCGRADTLSGIIGGLACRRLLARERPEQLVHKCTKAQLADHH